MFVTDKLVYLQLQKTACSHIAHTLSLCIGGEQHKKHRRLDPKFANKYIVGSIRNPWDWYVSLWAYGCAERGGLYERLTCKQGIRQIFRNNSSSNLYTSPNFFKQFIQQTYKDCTKPISHWHWCYADNKDPKRFQAWLKAILLPERKIDAMEGYEAKSLANITGLLTFRYLRIFSKDIDRILQGSSFKSLDEIMEFDKHSNILNDVIRTERLENDLIDVLSRAGYTLDEKQLKIIWSHKNSKQNRSEHLPMEHYYNDESLELVRTNEAFIIGKYGYETPTIQ